MGIVFVDVDGTLLRGPGSERLFIAHLAKHRRIGLLQFACAIAFFLRYGLEYGRFTPKKNKAYLAGLDCSETAALARTFVHERLESRLRPALLARLDRHRAVGHGIALLTGTPDFIAAPLADRIEADIWRATRCRQRGGKFSTDPPDMHPFAEAKLRHALEICALMGVDLAACTAYADSVYDLPLLERVACPVAVQPDPGLARAARQKGWEVLAETPAANRRADDLVQQGSRI